MKQNNHTFIRVVLLLLLTTHVSTVWTQQPVLDSLVQRLQRFTDSSVHTSIYLRTSKNVYETMEDVWFKAYLLDAQKLAPSTVDTTLYVQLIKAFGDSVVWQEKYLVNNGVVDGHLYLDNQLSEGEYLLCAYARHSLPRLHTGFTAFRRINVVRDVKTLFNSTASNEGKKPLANTRRMQFCLFPQGGHLVTGLPNIVAFKAVDTAGLPASVNGAVLENDQPIAFLKTVHAGMGSFHITPHAGSRYAIRLNGVDTTYTLGDIDTAGIVMNLAKQTNDSLVFQIKNTKGAPKQVVYLRLQVRGAVQLMASAVLKDSLAIRLPTTNMAHGIAEATLFNAMEQPVSERLFYIGLDTQLNISMTASKQSFNKREKVVLHIKTTDAMGHPAAAQLALSVSDVLYNTPQTISLLTYYYLRTQLRGKLYDPQYYFDSSHHDRHAAIDLLLLTQGWRSYQWNEANLTGLAKDINLPLTDGITGRLAMTKKAKGASQQKMLMIFNAGETEKEMLLLDDSAKFYLNARQLAVGRQVYIKHFAAGNGQYNIQVAEGFDTINQLRKQWTYTNEQLPPSVDSNRLAMQTLLQDRGAHKLQDVTVTSRKSGNSFRDKYIGQLDSIARLEHNVDFVSHGWLNCPACAGGTPPIEGRTYVRFIGKTLPSKHPFSFVREEIETVEYHYPKFTEEELLKKFGLARVKGYYPKKTFYEPGYDKDSSSNTPDFRNTLLWAPEVTTNENGEATVTFFCSDISSAFQVRVEGISNNNLLGQCNFTFVVK